MLPWHIWLLPSLASALLNCTAAFLDILLKAELRMRMTRWAGPAVVPRMPGMRWWRPEVVVAPAHLKQTAQRPWTCAEIAKQLQDLSNHLSDPFGSPTCQFPPFF